MNTHTHTPTPWRVEQDTTLIWGACNADDTSSYGMGYPVAECRISKISNWAKGPCEDEGEANAALIVKAVNSYASLIEEREEMVKALRAIVKPNGYDVGGANLTVARALLSRIGEERT